MLGTQHPLRTAILLALVGLVIAAIAHFFPEGQEPKPEWVYAEPTAEKWGSVLAQDFSNMEWVQKGQHSRGFRGPLPNPHQERKVTNFHRNLANYMGRGGLRTYK